LAARLNHRNVVRVLDIVEDGGCPWIVMELLLCRSLREQVEEEGPLGFARAAEIGLEIIAALRAAHAAGIVHRDVKPANILMAPDRVVLTDFGIARAAGPSALTTVGTLIGSPSYMAPERATGGQSGPPDDLWGLGASLYAAVEGHGPFDRDAGALASLIAVVADEAEPAAHAGPLWPVISGLLRKDPGERLDAATAERMLRAIGAAPAPDDPGTPALGRSRRAEALLIGFAALAVIAASGTTAAFAFNHPPEQAMAPAAAITPSPGAGPRPAAARAHSPAAHAHPPATAGTHLTARTSGASPSRPRPRRAARTTNRKTGNARTGAASRSWMIVRIGGFAFYLPSSQQRNWPPGPARPHWPRGGERQKGFR
jgi:hypothetical protein